MPTRETPEPQPTTRAEPRETGEGTRCPYCHGDVPADSLRSVCGACGAVHHVACFAEHRGCATHGCGSTEALTLRDPVQALARLACAQCKQHVPAGELVASCGCGSVFDVGCFEARGGRCGQPGCAHATLKLVAQNEARARSCEHYARVEERAARWLGGFSLLWSLGFLAILGIGSAIGGAPPIGVGVVLALLAALGIGGLFLARNSRRAGARNRAKAAELRQRPPEARRSPPPGPKG